MTPQTKRRFLRLWARCTRSEYAVVYFNVALFVLMAFIVGLTVGLTIVQGADRFQSLTLQSVVEACRK